MDTREMHVILEALCDQAEEGYLIPCRDKRGEIVLLSTSYCGDTLLHVAVGRNRADEVRLLLDLGLDINAQGDFMQTPLHLAASEKNIAIFNLLLELGANPVLTDSLGRTAHEILVELGDLSDPE